MVAYWDSLEWYSVVLVWVLNRLSHKVSSSHIALERPDHFTNNFKADEYDDEEPVCPMVYEQSPQLWIGLHSFAPLSPYHLQVINYLLHTSITI